MRVSIEAVWRLEATCLTGALLRAGADLALAEDCMHDAQVAAMQHGPAEGWPRAPRRLADDRREAPPAGPHAPCADGGAGSAIAGP